MLVSVTPFFIVDDLTATLAFYQSKLGFSVPYKGGGDGDVDDYWAFVRRDNVMLMFKAIAAMCIHTQILTAPVGALGCIYLHRQSRCALHRIRAKGIAMHRESAIRATI